jgi:hypothetical protein
LTRASIRNEKGRAKARPFSLLARSIQLVFYIDCSASVARMSAAMTLIEIERVTALKAVGQRARR